MADGKTSVLLVKIIGDATDAIQAMRQTAAATKVLEETIEQTSEDFDAWAKSVGKSTKSASDDVDMMSKAMKKGWKSAGVAAAAGGLAIVVGSSRAEQALQALETVWDEQADEMLAYVQTLEEYGISSQKAADATIFFGTILQNLGFTLEESSALTQQLITLSLDMAAVMGYTVPEAIQALSSAMRGEFEPIEKFGVTLNQAAVEAQMLEHELEGVTFASAQQAKVAAILAIIWEDTSEMHGKAAEEMNTLQGSTWNLIASVQNLITEVGLLANDELTGLIQALDGAVDSMKLMIEEGGLLDASLDFVQMTAQGLSDVLQPGLSEAIAWVDGAFEDLAGVINNTLIPALSSVWSWLDDLIGKMADTVEAIHDMGWEITEMFDHIIASAPDLSGLSAGTQVATPSARGQTASVGTQSSGPDINIVINAGVGSNPHAIAKEIRKVLQRDAIRMGRVA